VIVVAEGDGRAIVAALDDVQRLIGQKIPAEPRHRDLPVVSDKVTLNVRPTLIQL
jgi:hypothetical protein